MLVEQDCCLASSTWWRAQVLLSSLSVSWAATKRSISCNNSLGFSSAASLCMSGGFLLRSQKQLCPRG